MDYRRARVAGVTFFTVTLADRKSLQVGQPCPTLRRNGLINT